jgi:CRP-like cAMP-binding protein
MERNEIFDQIRKSYLFQQLSNEHIDQVISFCKEKILLKDSYLIREGEIDNNVFLLVSGKVQVLKKETVSSIEQQIATLEAGELIGEMVLVDNAPRSASVRAIEDSRLIVISFSDLLSKAKDTLTYAQIIQNISKRLVQKLRNTNALIVKTLQAELDGTRIRFEMGRYLFTMLICLTTWIFLVTILTKYVGKLNHTSVISLPLILIYFVVCMVHVKTSIFPPKFYGFTLSNWGKNAIEAILYSLPIMLLITLGKWMLIKHVPFFSNDQITALSVIENSKNLIYILIYILFCPFQEMIVRGVIQSSIKFSLSGPNAILWSIVLSN